MRPSAVRSIRSHGPWLTAALALLLIPLLWLWPPRGITARYYSNTNFRGEAVATRVESRFGLDAVEAATSTLPQQQFSLVMDAWLRVDEAGEHRFTTGSDDGSTLDVGDERVVDNGGYHARRTASGSISLQPGLHPLRLRYLQGGGAYDLDVRWTPPGGVESGIPVERLYVEQPSAPVVWLARHAGRLWALAWLALLLVGARHAMRSSRARGRTLGLQAAVVAGSILFTLVLVEVAVRVARFALEDRRSLETRLVEERAADQGGIRIYSLGDLVQPSEYERIVYELKPGLRGVFQRQPLATNSRGLRDAEYAYEKSPGTVRIVALGDSSLFGWGVPVEKTSMELLERMLTGNGASPAVEVLNFATPGYNTAIEAEVFVRKALRYDPDIVLVNFNTNDYDVPAFMRLPENYATLRRSFVFDMLYSYYEGWTGVPPQELPVFDFATRTLTFEEADRLDEDPGLPDEYRSMVGTRGFRRAMEQLVDTARAAGVEVVVFDVRIYPGLHESYVPNAFRDSQRELLERLSQELGFHWLNTYPYYVEYMNAHPDDPFPRVFSVSDTDSHPSALAHEINARALYDYLVREGMVGR